jgi:cytochrome c oxidase assembly factor CtaG
MTAVVMAHAGHWLPQLLYLAPLIVLVVAIAIGRLRERRQGREGSRRDDV